MLLETISGRFMPTTREFIRRMTRAELQEHLEQRGFAVYEDEPTELLRDTALDDFDSEFDFEN